LEAIAQAGHTSVIKPWPLRPAVQGGFTLDDFTVIEPDGDQPGSVTCPNGLTRPITARRGVTFARVVRCPLRALHHRQDRSLVDHQPGLDRPADAFHPGQ
jgi:hypothetical protein